MAFFLCVLFTPMIDSDIERQNVLVGYLNTLRERFKMRHDNRIQADEIDV